MPYHEGISLGEPRNTRKTRKGKARQGILYARLSESEGATAGQIEKWPAVAKSVTVQRFLPLSPTGGQIEKWPPVAGSREKVQVLGFEPSYGPEGLDARLGALTQPRSPGKGLLKMDCICACEFCTRTDQLSVISYQCENGLHTR
jgi:hypothetical protein